MIFFGQQWRRIALWIFAMAKYHGGEVPSIFKSRVGSWKVKADTVFPIVGVEREQKGLLAQKQVIVRAALCVPDPAPPHGGSPRLLKNCFQFLEKRERIF